MNILNKIKNLIKIGMKSSTVNEKIIKVEFLGQEKDVLKIIPYGLMYKLPNSDIMTVVLQQEGNEDALLGLCTDIKNRDDDLNELEVKIGIPTKKARIRFSDDDKIKFTIGETEGGDFAVRFNELKTAFDELKDDFNNFVNNVHNSSVVPHTHTGVTPGVGSTGTAVITTGTQSSADISPAKIEEIELPEL